MTVTKKFHKVCPSCTKTMYVEAETEEEIEGAIFDCSHCSLLLIQKEGEVLDFHLWMNKKHASWPSNGQGTYIQ